MSWQDRDSGGGDDSPFKFGRPGGDWQGVRPSLDNPMSWSLPLARIARIMIRVHLLFLVFILVMLIRSVLPEAGMTLTPMVSLLSALFLLVLLHEFGHCFACRAVGGSANEILLWPLGGLAYCQPRHRWKDHLITAAGGPLVNVIIMAVTIPVLGVATGQWWGVAAPNPFNLGGLDLLGDQGHWAADFVVQWLFFLNWCAIALLLLNLLPMFPLDGGRMLQCLLWPRMGYAASMRAAVYVGYFGAVILAVIAFVSTEMMLFAIALFGGITCWITAKQVQYTEEFLGFETAGYDTAPVPAEEPERESIGEAWTRRKEARRAERERLDAERVDEILRKISEHGMDSLTATERRILARDTRRRRETD